MGSSAQHRCCKSQVSSPVAVGRQGENRVEMLVRRWVRGGSVDVLTALMSSVNRKPRLGAGEEAQKHLESQAVNEWGGRVQLPGSAEGSLNIQGHEFKASAARRLASSSPPCSSSSCAGVEAGAAESGTRPGLAAWPSERGKQT